MLTSIMSNVPEEMIEEILSQLPVKSLLRFRCVSKAWGSLIGSKRFMRKQLKDSKRNTAFAHQRALLCPRGGKSFEFSKCSLSSLFHKPDIHPFGFNFANTTGVSIDSLHLVGSCNGLVCILLNSNEFVLWNPSTRISKKLPHIGYKVKPHSYGFGCDETSGDYKVVAIHWKEGFDVYSLYSLKSDSWKRISNGFSNVARNYNERGMLENGKLLWDACVAAQHKKIGFDLKREVFEIVEDRKACFCSVKVFEINILDRSSPSLTKCLKAPHGEEFNIRSVKIVDQSASTSTYDVDIYIESFETLEPYSHHIVS